MKTIIVCALLMLCSCASLPTTPIAPGVDAKWSAFGPYLQAMTDTVQLQWHRILAESRTSPPSNSFVSVRFVMNSEGRIAEIINVDGKCTDQGKRACVSGLTDRAPYGEWTPAMKSALGEKQEMTFTFYYR